MDQDSFSIAFFCAIDESVPRATGGQRLRQRGPQPVLAARAMTIMEVVGEYLGQEQDRDPFAYFLHQTAKMC